MSMPLCIQKLTTYLCSYIHTGMGIDKADVRLVVHWNIPNSVEGFYQESGRAGRDGRPAASVIFYDRSDASGMIFVINREEAKNAERRIEKLQEMTNYCELSDCCRRKHLLRHFGETYQRPADFDKKKCCDYCIDGGESVR